MIFQLSVDKFFNTYSYELKMFYLIFVSKGDTSQFFRETNAYEQNNINKPSKAVAR